MRFFSRKPLVSVILPSFNHATFVGEAVRSVLDQTFRDLELIVVDDGSSEGTADVVASVRDPVCAHPFVRERAVHPHNLALSLARGRYVAFRTRMMPGAGQARSSGNHGKRKRVCCMFHRGEIIDESGRPAAAGRTRFSPLLIARPCVGFGIFSTLEIACRCPRPWRVGRM
jgi:hypothetical protein